MMIQANQAVLVALATCMVFWSTPISKTSVESTVFPTPTLSLSFNSTTNVTLGNFTVNATSTLQANATSVVSSSVLPTIRTRVSNVTTPKDNVFFLEFKLLSREWNSAFISKTTSEFIVLANEITTKVDDVYHSRNDSEYNGSRIIGYREGVYVSVKVEFNPGPVVNASLLNPLVDFLRAGGTKGFNTDNVFMKISKYADCSIYYVDTQICHCPTKTYKMQMKCTEPDVTGGEPCPVRCYTGHQVTGAKLCTWDDLDNALCSARGLAPNVMLIIVLMLGMQLY